MNKQSWTLRIKILLIVVLLPMPSSAKAASLKEASNEKENSSNVVEASCTTWLENTLAQIAASGAIGKEIARFFAENYARKSRCASETSLLKNLLLHPGALEIAVLPLDIEALSLPPFAILVKQDLSTDQKRNGDGITAFAHEVIHLSQGIKGFSIQAELLTVMLEYRLEDEMGVAHDSQTELVAKKGWNPWDTQDLKAAAQALGGIYQHYPLRPLGGDFSKDWLSRWGY